MATLKPYRQYSEWDVINGLFSFGSTVEANAGTIVKVVSDYKDSANNISSIDNLSTIPNTVSALIGPVGQVVPTANWNDLNARPIGIILKSVREYDENGDMLLHNPRKAAEMDVVIPNLQAVPILTKGIIVIDDVDESNRGGGGGAPAPGDPAYAGDNGLFATDGAIVVGQFLSSKDSEGNVLIRIDF
jgi:hypothetical protein